MGFQLFSGSIEITDRGPWQLKFLRFFRMGEVLRDPLIKNECGPRLASQKRPQQSLSLIGITTSLICSLINNVVLIYDPTFHAIKVHQFNYKLTDIKAVFGSSFWTFIASC